MKKFYITGVSGTGKSTTGEELKKKGFHVVDIDKVSGLCKWVNKNTSEIYHGHAGTNKEFFKNNKRICDKEQLFSLFEGHDISIAVGLTDNQKEYLDLFDKVFLLRTDNEIFIKRIIERTNNDFGKHESVQEMMKDWHKDFERKMIDMGAIPINTNKPLEEVVEEVIKNIKS